MKLKELHALMQDIAPFPRPKVDLEQYPTGPHLASRLLFAVDSSYGELEGRTVVDLGCGTAMLSIGAALLGSRHVIGLDIDPDALQVAADNAEQYDEPLPMDFVLADVRELPTQLPRLRADVVIMNPPFGTKQKGADLAFLRCAFCVATSSVYSLHKSSTRDFIAKTAKRELGAASAEVVAHLRYDLPSTMRFHKQKSVDIEVDLWRFVVGERAASHRAVSDLPPCPVVGTGQALSTASEVMHAQGGGQSTARIGGGRRQRGGANASRGGRTGEMGSRSESSEEQEQEIRTEAEGEADEQELHER